MRTGDPGLKPRGLDPRNRDGFILGFVLLMLFAVSVMGATGYIVVSAEAGLASSSSESQEALTIARAALQRFVAEQVGVMGDSVYYAIGDGVALVTATKVFEQDSVTDMYSIRAVAEVGGAALDEGPALRGVISYALHHRRPLGHHAAVTVMAGNLQLGSEAIISGVDHSTADQCEGGGADSVIPIVALNHAALPEPETDTGGGVQPPILTEEAMVAESMDGDAYVVVGYDDRKLAAEHDRMAEIVDIRWDVLSDASFPVDYVDVLPNFSTLPADSFPVIRINGRKIFGEHQSGHGLLILTGEFNAYSTFEWDGVILAGSVGRVDGHIDGLLVAGMNQPNPHTVDFRGTAAYNACTVYAANESLSYVELLDNSMYEIS